MMSLQVKQRGFSIVEIIVSAAIIVTVVTAAAGAWQMYFKLLNASSAETQAALITEEAFEGLNFLRDQSWTANIKPLALESKYYLIWSAGKPALTSTRTEFKSGYAAEVAFSAVERDASNNVTSSGGIVDNRTLSAFITITPINDGTKIISQTETLIHDLFKN